MYELESMNVRNNKYNTNILEDSNFVLNLNDEEEFEYIIPRDEYDSIQQACYQDEEQFNDKILDSDFDDVGMYFNDYGLSHIDINMGNHNQYKGDFEGNFKCGNYESI